MPITYPPELPAHTEWVVQTRDRNAGDPTAPGSDVRNRSLDEHDIARASWIYTPEEMNIWVPFRRATLINGLRWFSMPAFGPGGLIDRVVRYRMSTLRVRSISSGIWQVSCDMDVRGLSLAPEEAAEPLCIDEAFSTELSAYDVESGTDDAFSVAAGVLSIEQGGPDLSEIRRTFTAREVVTVAFKFRLTSLNSDDACILRLLASGVQALAFWPRRELLLSSGIGSAHATVGIAGSIGGVTPAALDIDTDYQFELAIVPGIGASTLDITRISDATVIASNNLAGELAGSMPGVDQLAFLVDAGGSGLSETRYWDIHICAAEAEEV